MTLFVGSTIHSFQSGPRCQSDQRDVEIYCDPSGPISHRFWTQPRCVLSLINVTVFCFMLFDIGMSCVCQRWSNKDIQRVKFVFVKNCACEFERTGSLFLVCLLSRILGLFVMNTYLIKILHSEFLWKAIGTLFVMCNVYYVSTWRKNVQLVKI